MISHRHSPRNASWLRELVPTRWGAWAMPGPPPRALHLLQLAAGNWHVGQQRIIWLVFADGRREPVVVCKCAVGERCQPIVNEYVALEALHREAGRLGFSVPRPLELHDDPGSTALIESCSPGLPAHTGSMRYALRSEVQAIARGLSLAGKLCLKLRENSGPASHPSGDAHPRSTRLIERVAELGRSGSLGDWPGLTIARVQSALARLRLPHPCTCHGDLTSDHLLIDGQSWTVIDWEAYSPDGFPLTDPVHYCLTLQHYFNAADVDTVGAALFGLEPGGASRAYATLRDTLAYLREGLGAGEEEFQVWTALSVFDDVIGAKWAALKGGAREPNWDRLMGTTLEVLGLGSE
ncbi:MAG: phosphotransferase [Phycisphaerae bacterium]